MFILVLNTKRQKNKFDKQQTPPHLCYRENKRKVTQTHRQYSKQIQCQLSLFIHCYCSAAMATEQEEEEGQQHPQYLTAGNFTSAWDSTVIAMEA